MFSSMPFLVMCSSRRCCTNVIVAEASFSLSLVGSPRGGAGDAQGELIADRLLTLLPIEAKSCRGSEFALKDRCSILTCMISCSLVSNAYPQSCHLHGNEDINVACEV